MLTPPDADLVRRDGAVPGLRTLLDPEDFELSLGSRIRDVAPGSARLAYLRYKPSWSCLAAYRVEVAGKPLDVYAKALARDAGLEYEAAGQSLGTPHARGLGRFRLPEGSIVVCVYPDDLRLSQIDRAIHAGSRQRMLCKLVPDRPELWDAEARLLGYRPERRHVSRLLPARGAGAALKLYARKAFAAAERSARSLRPGPTLRIAPTLGSSERHRALVIAWLEGRSLRELIRGEEPLAAPLAAVGRALAELHAQSTVGLAPRPRRVEAAAVRARALWLGFLLPAAAGRAERVAAAAERAIGRLPAAVRPVHGDFYDKQVVLGSDGVGVLDLDQAALADPGRDLGVFLAHLELDAALGRLAPRRAAAAAEAFLAGYGLERRQPMGEAARAYAAASLLDLASYPFRRRSSGWPELLERLLERAGELAGAAR